MTRVIIAQLPVSNNIAELPGLGQGVYILDDSFQSSTVTSVEVTVSTITINREE